MEKSIVFIDSEIGTDDKTVRDLGAVRSDGARFHGADRREFAAFVGGADFVCGHNILRHDLEYVRLGDGAALPERAIDTLFLSPLLFPFKASHALPKDDKLDADSPNNPLNDARKAKELFYAELEAFSALSADWKDICCGLLKTIPEFQGFFRYAGYAPATEDPLLAVRRLFAGRICERADLSALAKTRPVELAYALALIGTEGSPSVAPGWLTRNYPETETVARLLRNTPCREGCAYCDAQLGLRGKLKEFFGFDEFRTYGGEPLQEQAARAAAEGRSLLAVFPTGGGKSLAFQLPALIAGDAERGLTVVISPLQSLMKDQVDHLNAIGRTDAVAVNGLLSPLERADALNRARDGRASLLYVSPEQLRSRTIERLLLGRNVVRFVIDEAHCFSAWGHDFRVEYLHIGDFIRAYQEKKGSGAKVQVSCFTATAKREVVRDIRDYFKEKLDLELETFISDAPRENLRYAVLRRDSEELKYDALRSLIEEKDVPTIVYVSRVRRAKRLAARLSEDGFRAVPFYGDMAPAEKSAVQEAFIGNETGIIVATSAFGMGVDKKDVGLVVHFDIPPSLEDYAQESGRAGRDPETRAECYILFGDDDLDQHFSLLNMSKLTCDEIKQAWRGVKELSKGRSVVRCSPLELGRSAGWDTSRDGFETRLRVAVAALENAGYLERGFNVPRVYATSIAVADMEAASRIIDASDLFTDAQKLNSKRIVSSLISSRSIATARDEDAESRVDYLADILGLSLREVMECVSRLRQAGILSDWQDLSAFLGRNPGRALTEFAGLERFILERLTDREETFSLKQLNEEAKARGLGRASVRNIQTVLFYLALHKDIRPLKYSENQRVVIAPLTDPSRMIARLEKRVELCRFILKKLEGTAAPSREGEAGKLAVQFSLVGLHAACAREPLSLFRRSDVSLAEVEEALLYLSKIGALSLDGGFMVLYNGMEIIRLVTANNTTYKQSDYKALRTHYDQKVRQIHMVGEYARLLEGDPKKAERYMRDYFELEGRKFLSKYFKGRRGRLDLNITPAKYDELFGALSDEQIRVVGDKESEAIVVAAGPGSGKTRVLVHKLAALLLMEDVKSDQLLMLTFSRAAATEFKKRLIDLIGPAARYVEVRTFHSYCFDLMGRVGSVAESESVIREATRMIENGEAEERRLAKTALVIDEAQDMDEASFSLVRALKERNENLRVIAVGDDDQSIYGFRGSGPEHMRSIVEDWGATRYEMTDNYRSRPNIVALSNAFVETVGGRMKTTPIRATDPRDGVVRITRHPRGDMTEPVARQIAETYRGERACVLTHTNDEALLVAGLLRRNGTPSRLIQSNDGFSLFNLAELRYFLKQLAEEADSPVVGDAAWETAAERLKARYATSSCLDACMRLLRDFEETRSGLRYRSDLEEFIKESRLEDFYDGERGTVWVSTIHKAKGREFDTVYMLFDHPVRDDADRRELYVGMTRARENLFIHCREGLFDGYEIPGVEILTASETYPRPRRLSLELSHKDVYLDFFKGRKRDVLSLRSGDPLAPRGEYLAAERGGREFPAVRLSKRGRERVGKLEKMGYRPCGAETRFVVAWKGEQDEEESAVALPTVYFSKER